MMHSHNPDSGSVPSWIYPDCDYIPSRHYQSRVFIPNDQSCSLGINAHLGQVLTRSLGTTHAKSASVPSIHLFSGMVPI